MPVLILVILLTMAVVWKRFQNDGTPGEGDPEEVQRITLLACYERKEQQDSLEEIAREYSGLNDGIQVEVEFIAREDLKKEICLGVDEGKQPDLVICSSMEMAGLMGMGVLENVEEALAEEVKSRLLYPERMQSVMSGGNYYSLPFSLDPYVMFSNSKYLKEIRTGGPESWEEMLEICGRIDGNGVSGLGFGAKHTSGAAELFRSIIFTYGGNFYNLSEEPGIQALTLLDTLKKRGDVNKNVINCTGKDAAREFAREKVVFLIAPVSTRVWLNQNGQDLEYQINPIPGAVKGLAPGGDNLGFCRGAGREAARFGAYLYEEGVRSRLLAAMGSLPLFSGEEEAIEEKEVQRLNQVFAENRTRLETYYAWFEISDVLSKYFYDILAKKNVDLSAMAASLQDEMRVAIMSYSQ